MKLDHNTALKHINVRRDQRGIAALVITMVTMVVISLIVIGFATISRREQRQSLDQQLSTQAFYAAESGITDAKEVIQTALATAGHTVKAKNNCTTNNPGPGDNYPVPNTGPGPSPTDKTVIDAANNVSYTCLTVDDSPNSLQFNGVGENSVVVPITTANPITSVTIKWTPTSTPPTTPSTCPATTSNTLSQQASWNCGYGMLRADLTPTDGVLSRSNLISGTITGFFEPLNNNPAGAGQLNYITNKGKPNLVAAQCDLSSAYGGCTATISNISGGNRKLSLRLSSLYQPANLTIQAFGGAAIQDITGVQATIDSTGKAQDVLRRIQVRLPIVQTGGLMPDYAIQSSGSICKRFVTKDDYFAVAGGIKDPDTTNAMCDDSVSDGTP